MNILLCPWLSLCPWSDAEAWAEFLGTVKFEDFDFFVVFVFVFQNDSDYLYPL